AAERFDKFIPLPAQAVGTSVSSMAGQGIGVGVGDRVKQMSKTAVLYILSIMGVMALLVVILAVFGVELFIRDPEAVAFGTSYLQIVALCFPFLGINFVLNGIVRAAGAMYQY